MDKNLNTCPPIYIEAQINRYFTFAIDDRAISECLNAHRKASTAHRERKRERRERERESEEQLKMSDFMTYLSSRIHKAYRSIEGDLILTVKTNDFSLGMCFD